MPAVNLLDYGPLANNGFYIFNSGFPDYLSAAPGLVAGDGAITWDGIHNLPSPSSYGQFGFTTFPLDPISPFHVTPQFMFQNGGDLYMRSWFNIPAGFNATTDGIDARIFNIGIKNYGGFGGRGFELNLTARPQGLDTNGNPTGGMIFEFNRSPYATASPTSYELYNGATVSGFFGGFEWIQGPLAVPGPHQICISYEQATGLTSFYYDGAIIGVPRAGTPQGLDFTGTVLTNYGQPYGHVDGSTPYSTTAMGCDISDIQFGQFVPNQVLGGTLLDWSPDVYDEFDFGGSTLSAAHVAADYAAAGSSWAAYTAAVLSRSPRNAFHLDEYGSPAPPAGAWHVGKIAMGANGGLT